MQSITTIFKRDDGAAAAVIALSFPVLFGAAALAVDGGWIYVHNVKLQHAADSAALGGATLSLPIDLDLTKPGVKTNIETQTLKVSNVGEKNVSGSLKPADVTFGCWDGKNFSLAQCPKDGLANAVRVATREYGLRLFFASLMGYESIDLAGSAVGAKLSAPACLIILNKQAVNSNDEAVVGLSYAGDTELKMPSCGIHVNGQIDGKGIKATVDTSYLCAGSKSDRTKISSIRAPYREHCGSLANPYEHLSYSQPSGSPISVDSNDDEEINPGVYSSVSVQKNLTLKPGKYVIDGGKLSVKGDVTGDGVTIILRNGATLDLGGSASVSLKAPSEGDTKGFVFIQNDGNSGISELGGTSSLEINGSIYLEDQTLVMKGNPNVDATDNPWSSIVVDKLDMRGTSNLRLRPPTGAEFESNPQLPTRPHLVQ